MYTLITPARNEEAYIEKTIKSVISQTLLPVKWVIVSDGSTDRTDEIAEKYAAEYDFITLVKADSTEKRNFGSKVNAFNAGFETLGDIKYDFIGNLDADVSFEPTYFENLVSEFQKNHELGIGGGIICEIYGDKIIKRSIKTSSQKSVAGAVQLFRRKCFEDIGGYVPLEIGGIDAYAETKARMKGWSVRTFADLPVLHHRRVGKMEGSFFRAGFKQGISNYCMGYHPLYQIMVSVYRSFDRPYIFSALGMNMLAGYFWAMLKKHERPVSDEFVRFVRKEQLHKIGLKI